jgi:hypothetical protein
VTQSREAIRRPLETRGKSNKRKGNIMKQLLALICGAATTSGTSDTTTSSTMSNSSGTVTDYTPGAAITIDPGTSQPVHFIIGKTVQIVAPDGQVIKAAEVKNNTKVHVHLVADGDRTVVDKITVDDAQ